MLSWTKLNQSRRSNHKQRFSQSWRSRPPNAPILSMNSQSRNHLVRYFNPFFFQVCPHGLSLSVQQALRNQLIAEDEIIQSYQRKFKDLKTAFNGRAVLETEMAVGRVEDAIHLMDITVTRVLGITSDAGELLCRTLHFFSWSHGSRCTSRYDCHQRYSLRSRRQVSYQLY